MPLGNSWDVFHVFSVSCIEILLEELQTWYILLMCGLRETRKKDIAGQAFCFLQVYTSLASGSLPPRVPLVSDFWKQTLPSSWSLDTRIACLQGF